MTTLSLRARRSLNPSAIVALIQGQSVKAGVIATAITLAAMFAGAATLATVAACVAMTALCIAAETPATKGGAK